MLKEDYRVKKKFHIHSWIKPIGELESQGKKSAPHLLPRLL